MRYDKRVQLKSKYITQIPRGGLTPRKGAYGTDRAVIPENTNEKEEKTPQTKHLAR